MYMMKKSLAVLLALLLVLGMFAIPAYAAETSQDGLAVALTTDKKEYARNETITATLTVKNTNKVAVKNVSLESVVPEGYVLAKGDETALQVEELAAGQTVTGIRFRYCAARASIYSFTSPKTKSISFSGCCRFFR